MNSLDMIDGLMNATWYDKETNENICYISKGMLKQIKKDLEILNTLKKQISMVKNSIDPCYFSILFDDNGYLLIDKENVEQVSKWVKEINMAVENKKKKRSDKNENT